MYSSSPILLSATPPSGYMIPVAEGQGELAGYVLLGQSGPLATVDIQATPAGTWIAVTYPHTLASGETLRVIRTDPSPLLTTLRALAPVSEGEIQAPSFVVTTDMDGYESIAGAETTTDLGGYQTILNATITADPDGYESVERS